MKKKWTPQEIPGLAGQFAVVTGGTSGIGFHVALELARNGAHVVIAADHAEKGERVVRRIRREHPAAMVEFERVDLSDLSSVRAFASSILARDRALDLLVNNAGLTGVPNRALTKDGFELMFAANYLGHFVLTSRLMPILRRKPLSRVVSMSSLSHRSAELRFDNLQGELEYDPEEAYGCSKLAILLFAIELHRRARAAGLSLLSIPVHPGGSRTQIFSNGPYLNGTPRLQSRWLAAFIWMMGQSAERGAWPALCAATSPAARSGIYYGPGGFREIRGYPAVAELAPQAKRRADAERLWSISQRLSGEEFGLDPVPSRRLRIEDVRTRPQSEPIPAM